MATGEYRDPIAEREAKYAAADSTEVDATTENSEASTPDVPAHSESSESADDISFEDL